MSRDKRSLFLLREQFFDLFAHDLLAFCVFRVQFTVPAVTHKPLLVDEIDARPPAIAPRCPSLGFGIDRDRILDPIVLDLLSHRFDLLLSVGLCRMDANDGDAFVGKVLVPARVPRVIADAVDSPERPEM